MKAIEMMVCQDMPAPGRVVDMKLAALRAQFPFLEIQPAPLQVIAVKLVANVPSLVNLPDGTQMVKFSTQAFQDFYVTLQGKAAEPAAGGVPEYPGALVNPQGWFYVAELRQLSIVGGGVFVVSVHCHVQQ